MRTTDVKRHGDPPQHSVVTPESVRMARRGMTQRRHFANFNTTSILLRLQVPQAAEPKLDVATT
jgi:hypothetical protein